jgi:hypothetical protein
VSPLAPDQLALLRALERHGVEFVVVGGVAAQIHGWRGATADLDIAVASDTSNVERLNRALHAVSAGEPAIGAFGSAFKTRHGRLEIVRRAHAVGDYEGWALNAERREVHDGLTVAVADKEDILRSKEAAGRAKDLAALDQMRADLAGSGSS